MLSTRPSKNSPSYWLIKSEGDCYSIDDLKRDKKTAWTGIRNYQARNYMRDGMKVGDMVLFYHSAGENYTSPTGVYGLARVASPAAPDKTALDPKDEHYDPKHEWICVEIAYVSKFTKPVTLAEIKADKELRGMLVAKTGQRLSVMPVEEAHYMSVVEIASKGSII